MHQSEVWPLIVDPLPCLPVFLCSSFCVCFIFKKTQSSYKRKESENWCILEQENPVLLSASPTAREYHDEAVM
jgi:hypothetical protein